MGCTIVALSDLHFGVVEHGALQHIAFNYADAVDWAIRAHDLETADTMAHPRAETTRRIET
jgi:hypothetical protein